MMALILVRLLAQAGIFLACVPVAVQQLIKGEVVGALVTCLLGAALGGMVGPSVQERARFKAFQQQRERAMQ